MVYGVSVSMLFFYSVAFVGLDILLVFRCRLLWVLRLVGVGVRRSADFVGLVVGCVGGGFVSWWVGRGSCLVGI